MDGSTYVQLAFALLILGISFILTRREKQLLLNEPPLVPYKYPIIGHTFDYFKDSKSFLDKCQAEYGDIFSLYVYGQIQTIIGKGLSPEIFKNYKVFNHVDAQLDKFPMSSFIRRPRPFLDTTSEILQKALPGDLKFYVERFQRHLPKTIDEIIGDGKVLQPPLKTLRVIIALLAATSIAEELSEDKELINAFAHATDDLAPYLSTPPFLSFIHPMLQKYFLILLFHVINPFKARSELFKQKIVPVVEKRLHEMEEKGDAYIPPVDILQKFIEIFHYDYDAITDIVSSTVFASIITTSTFLTYSLQEFANHPQFQEELLKEQEEIFKDKDGSLLNKLAKMEKLDSFVRETLRVNAEIVGSHKVISSHFTFSNGYQVPKDRVVYLYLQEIHSNEKAYGSNANEFDAFRHLKNSATHPERNYLTFGMGKYACPGRSLAVNGIKSVLHHLLLRYNIKNVGDEIVKPKVIGTNKLPNDTGIIFERKKLNDV